MTQEDLDAAVEKVREAAEHAHEDRPAEELGKIADDLQELASSHDSPDEKRIRGHHYTLRELHGELNEDARVHLEDAIGHVESVKDKVGIGGS
ncbi:DUF7553 family protein [Halospeciosus flavus]|uniref:Uncharacterized protein n=1 Tax=Halospeciosus flavus TaxID=3032283 RepID=A0ABD5Z792_9EURY|nr:hypothetical protein [Halospeciosus flavus]